MGKEVSLSVCIITYNQEKYIRNTIEGVLFQKTDFDVELIIGEDFSTDNTRQICQEYLSKHPNRINILPSDKNIGAIPNFVRTLNACRGKYIAICEGDDYWTDSSKLQKQVDFLEANQDYSMCFHQALVKFDDVKGNDHLFCDQNVQETTGMKEVISLWYIPTCAIVYKNAFTEIPLWMNYIHNGDYGLQLLLADKGKIKYIPEEMAVYRKHSTSFSYMLKSKFVWEQKIKVLQYFDLYSEFHYHELIEEQILIYYKDYLKILLEPQTFLKKITSIKWIAKKLMRVINLLQIKT